MFVCVIKHRLVFYSHENRCTISIHHYMHINILIINILFMYIIWCTQSAELYIMIYDRYKVGKVFHSRSLN